MTWFLIALGAPILWAFTNIADQYLVQKYAKGERGSGGLVLFSSLIGIFIALCILLFTGRVFEISLLNKLLLLLTGGLTIAWVILYLFALELEDVSFVVPWFLLVPVYGYILGYFFLGETLSAKEEIGSIIVLLGLLILSVDFRKAKGKKIKWRPALYMALACFILATIGVIFKYVTIEGDFWVSSFWEYVGLGLSGALIFVFVPKYRREFMYMNNKGGKSIFSVNILNELATSAGNMLTNFAILLAPITLVYLVSSFQPAILLFLTIFCTYFFPNIVKEDMDKSVLIPKIIAIIIAIFGSIILFL